MINENSDASETLGGDPAARWGRSASRSIAQGATSASVGSDCAVGIGGLPGWQPNPDASEAGPAPYRRNAYSSNHAGLALDNVTQEPLRNRGWQRLAGGTRPSPKPRPIAISARAPPWCRSQRRDEAVTTLFGVRAAMATADILVTDIREGLHQNADPSYVAGTVVARKPGKSVLGVRIPLVRDVVRSGLRRARNGRKPIDPGTIMVVADMLWDGDIHEEELAACKMLRSTAVHPSAVSILRWADYLDNWLSVDELGAVAGRSLVANPDLLRGLAPLAGSESPWQRRLYLVSLIRPICAGLAPAAVPHLAPLLADKTKPVRKATAWLINQVHKAQPEAATELRQALS